MTEKRVHDLKCWPVFFQAIKRGEKPWELRDNDRDYQVGDVLRLHEWEPSAGRYTGDALTRSVPFILRGDGGWLPEGKCIMSLAPEALSRDQGELIEDINFVRDAIFAERGGAYSQYVAKAIHRITDALASALSLQPEPGVGEIEPAPKPGGIDFGNWTYNTLPERTGNVGWQPTLQDLIDTAINHVEGDYEDADDNCAEQVIERLVLAIKALLCILPTSLSGLTEGLKRARAFYLAMYGVDGGHWEAVDPRHHHVWVDKADRFAWLCGLPTPPTPQSKTEGEGARQSDWQPIATLPHPHDIGCFWAALRVSARGGPLEWQIDMIALDDETGDVHADWYRGWDLSDYELWCPAPVPASPKDDTSSESDHLWEVINPIPTQSKGDAG